MTSDSSQGFLTPELSRTLNALGLLAIGVVLLFAFYDQIVGGELPCPLCILQRAASSASASASRSTCASGRGRATTPSPSSRPWPAAPSRPGRCCCTSCPAAAPSARISSACTSTAGRWCCSSSSSPAAPCCCCSTASSRPAPPDTRLGGLALAGFALIALLALGNGVSTVLECAGGLCPDNPVSYQLLEEEPETPPSTP